MGPAMLGVLFLMLYVFVALFAAISSVKKTILKTTLVCPDDGKEKEVGFFVNIFRNPEKRVGINVETCSRFCNGEGAVTCEKHCLALKETKALHQREFLQHREDLVRTCGTV